MTGGTDSAAGRPGSVQPGSVEAGAAHAAPAVRVWDIVVRVFHWSLVAGIAIAWISADEWDGLHEWTGYVIAGLVGLRLLWGLVGSRHARFASFIRGPAAVRRYLGDMLRGRERRHLGHNPAGAAMIVALLGTIAGICLTGWMQTTDAFWGVGWVEGLHETLANLLLVLVGLHVLGVLYASLRHGENLARAMLTGRKRPPAAGDLA